MANKEYELAIKIAGMIDQSLGEACNLTKKQLRSVAKEAASAKKESTSFTSAMGAAGSGIDSAWNGATKVVKTTAEVLLAAGAAAGVAGAAVISVGSDFESAFAGVRKTVNATDEQLADLEEGIREMAKNKPQTAVELSEIAEAAGQLGIHTENIEDFTSTMADLKVATNLGDEGAAEFAKFANIVGMSQDKFENLGSAVVALGNNSATTEADIMAMAMRLAGAGSQVGMTEADIVGFAASLSSVGIEAEAGGSAVSKTMVDMQLAVEKGGESLNQYAKVAGMSSNEFKKAFKDDAAQAITAFIGGLNDTDRLGQSAIATLSDMDIKEVRLRDTLLRAANASDLFSNTLDLSSKAFEENTALTKEAEQRYATFESRTDMVKNRITDLGITLYQDFRDPLSDALEVALQFTDETDLFDPDYIEGVAKNFQKNIPTVIRQVGDAKDAIMDFAGPFLEVGDWMIENPDVIAGTLAGIGTTIASLKLAETVTKTASAMNALRIAMMSNPITAAVGVAALAGGALIGISTKVKMANAEMEKQNLADHFGEISLSLSELDKVVEHILDTGNRKNMDSFIEQMEKVNDVSKDLSDQESILKKLNWKISMGMELSESDLTSYAGTLSDYIESSISLVEQQHYTATVALSTLFEGEAGSSIISNLDEFYGSVETEVRAAGDLLGRAYKSAMEDEIISPIEQENIDKLIKNLQEMKNQVMEAESQAEWSILQEDYFNAGKVDSDTFLNLQEKISAQSEEDMNTYRKAYETTLAANALSLNKTLEDPNSTEVEKENARQEAAYTERSAKNAYQDRTIETQEKTFNFTMDTMEKQYPEVFSQIDNFQGTISDYLDNSIATNADGWSENASKQYVEALEQIKDSPEISQASRDAMGKILEGIEPQTERFESIAENYRKQGLKVPKAIDEALNEVGLIRAILGDESKITQLMDEHLANSPEAVQLLSTAAELGGWVPEFMSDGMLGNTNSIDEAVNSLHDHLEEQLQDRFGNMTVYGNVDFNMGVGSVTTRQSSSSNPHGVVGHATGGIFDKEHLAWISEENQAEAIVPLDGSQHAKSIWQEAGEALGVLDGDSSSGEGNVSSSGGTDNSESNITYSTVINVYGGGNVETMKEAVDDGYKKFETFMNQYQRNQKRLRF